MKALMTESLVINDQEVELHEGRSKLKQYYAQLAASVGAQPIVDNFSSMILGVANANSLDQEQKDYLIDMLEEQMNIELQCNLMYKQ